MVTAAKVAAADVAVLAASAANAKLPALDVSVLAAPPTGSKVAALDVAALAYVAPCSTKRAQLWTLTRKDGQVFRFTSHDVDVSLGAFTWKACGAVLDSASESASDLGSVGNIEMTGVFESGAITPDDLYAGLWDDAYVEAWVWPWDGVIDSAAPFRIAAGWTGKVTRGEANWTAEVLGPGARLQQAALVDFYAPGCRWDFGSVQCGVDAESFKLAGLTVAAGSIRSLVEFSHSAPGGATLWNGGKVRWLTGRSAGITCQVETVDFGAGVLSLWDLAPYPPQAGDTFDLLPGCPKTKPGCVAYSNYVNFGGFANVPGPDALQSNADSLFTGANG